MSPDSRNGPPAVLSPPYMGFVVVVVSYVHEAATAGAITSEFAALSRGVPAARSPPTARSGSPLPPFWPARRSSRPPSSRARP